MHILVRGRIVTDSEGRPVKTVGVNQDVTEQKRITAELRESEERYRTAIESSSDGIAMVRGDTHLYVNRKFLEIFGFDDIDQVVGQPVGLAVHPDDREKVVGINRLRQRNEEAPRQYEFKGVKTNGDTLFIEASATRTVYKGEPISLIYLRDVTEKEGSRPNSGRPRRWRPSAPWRAAWPTTSTTSSRSSWVSATSSR